MIDNFVLTSPLSDSLFKEVVFDSIKHGVLAVGNSGNSYPSLYEFIENNLVRTRFNFPNLVTYAESHDEERLMYKNLTFGNGAAKDLNTALKRTEAAMAMLIPLKGPKMLWQFEELGFDSLD
jgi:hypothetical protein